MQNEFLEKCDQLVNKLNQLEVNKRVSLQQIKSCNEELVELLGELEKIDIPVVDGNKVFNLTIDQSKLGNYQYVHELNEKLPLALQNLESFGLKLVNQIQI